MSSRHDRGFVEVPEIESEDSKSSLNKKFVPHGPNSFVLILCVVILVLLGAVGYLLKRPNLYNNSSSTSLIFPADITNPSVASVALLYDYRGTVTGVKNENENIILQTDIKGDVPQFVVEKTTVNYLYSKGKEIMVLPTLIKAGDKVALYETYDLTTKTWKLNKVDVIVEQLPKQSPAPSPKLQTKASPKATPNVKR